MAVKVQLQIRGLDSVNDQLAALIATAPALGAKALRAEAEIEMTEAKRRTPVDTGALRDSGFVDGPDTDGDVTLTFGGPSAPYAVEVHENLEAFHDDGQAKFLESAVMESLPYLVERVAERMNVYIAGLIGRRPSESFDSSSYDVSDPSSEDDAS